MRTVEHLPDACVHAGTQMLHATKALVLADDGQARDVIRVHEQLAARTVLAQASALDLLVRHEGDLPGLSASLQIIADLNEMNLLARRVARVALRAYPEHALPEDVNEYFTEMGERADQLGTRLGQFLEGTTEMHRIGHEEDEIDRQHRRLLEAMTAPGEWFHSIAVALDVLRLDIYYERFTDYAAAIAHRVQKLNEDIPPTPNSQ
jgi:phosphate transport system protein